MATRYSPPLQNTLDFIEECKTKRAKTDDKVEEERLSIMIKRMEMTLEGTITEEIESFFSWALWVLSNIPYPDCVEGYQYYQKKKEFCKKHHFIY